LRAVGVTRRRETQIRRHDECKQSEGAEGRPEHTPEWPKTERWGVDVFLRTLACAADDPAVSVRVCFTLRDDFVGQVARGTDARTLLGGLFVLQTWPGVIAIDKTIKSMMRPLHDTGDAVGPSEDRGRFAKSLAFEVRPALGAKLRETRSARPEPCGVLLHGRE